MLRSLRPTLITLTLAVPTASQALGLGDIHVDSALHQPLVAQIELVGVLDGELGRLSATIASDELFQRYNLERAPFIYGTSLALGRDAQGRPILNMRSTEKFTEPVVTLLVDLHTPNGELIREYTLFLDPSGLTSNLGAAAKTERVGGTSGLAGPDHESADSAIQSPASVPTKQTAAAGASSRLPGETYTVARRDTLAHIVSATGARSRIDRHRMMIAIFRANPAAFQNNFNRMHTGVTLKLPSTGQLAAISVDETNREYDTQMAEWRASTHRGAPGSTSTAANGTAANGTASSGTAASGTATASPAIADAGAGSAARTAAVSTAAKAPNASDAPVESAADSEHLPTDRAALTQRVASLEQSLARIQHELKQPLVAQAVGARRAPVTASALTSTAAPAAAALMDAAPKFAPTTAATSHADISAPADEATSEDDEDDTAPKQSHAVQWVSIAAGIGLAVFAGAWFFLRRRSYSANYAGPRHVSPLASAAVEAVDTVEFSNAPPPRPLTSATVSAPVAVEKTAAIDPPQATTPKSAKSESSWFEDSFSTPIADLLNDPTVSLAIEDTAALPVEPTVKLPQPASPEAMDTTVLLGPDFEVVGDTVEQKFSFFNPERSTNTEHVVMGSGLNEPKAFVERRRNPVDVLRQAIEREPDRSDLRLKLLELYYTAAAENRQAFLEATRQLTKNEELASAEDWARIADMGRIIAPDDELFSEELDDKRVA